MKRGLITVLVALTLVGCGSSGAERDSGTVIVQGAASFPYETMVDWVSYSDQVSVVTVLSEADVPDPSIAQNGEGYIGRELTVRIDQTVWSAPGVSPADGELQFVTVGWSVHSDGSRAPAILEGALPLHIGHSYLLPLARINDKLGPLSPSAIAEVVSSRVEVVGAAPIEALDLIDEDRLAQVASELANTEPDPIAVKYGDLPPYERARAVIEEKAA